MKTVMLQSESAATRTDKGYNPANDIQKVTAGEGVHALFSQKLEELNKKYSKTWYLYDKKGETSQDLLVLKTFIELAERREGNYNIILEPPS